MTYNVTLKWDVCVTVITNLADVNWTVTAINKLRLPPKLLMTPRIPPPTHRRGRGPPWRMDTNQQMRPIATGGVAWSVCLCLSVGHVREPCKNGWTDRDAVWVGDSGGPKEPYVCIRWVHPMYPKGRGNFGGCPVSDCSGVLTYADCSVRSKEIDRPNVISATAAAHCIAPDWPVSHQLSPWKNRFCDAASRQNFSTTCYFDCRTYGTCNVIVTADLEFSGYAVRYLRPNVTQAWKVGLLYCVTAFTSP